MGGFFGIASRKECLMDVFFGTDYHSHLGTRRGGLAAYDPELGLQRSIHNISNSPFRTKFEKIFDDMQGTSAIGCISDSDPQPLIIRSRFGAFAICTIGIINNSEELIKEFFEVSGAHFNAMTAGAVNQGGYSLKVLCRAASDGATVILHFRELIITSDGRIQQVKGEQEAVSVYPGE